MKYKYLYKTKKIIIIINEKNIYNFFIFININPTLFVITSSYNFFFLKHITYFSLYIYLSNINN